MEDREVNDICEDDVSFVNEYLRNNPNMQSVIENLHNIVYSPNSAELQPLPNLQHNQFADQIPYGQIDSVHTSSHGEINSSDQPFVSQQHPGSFEQQQQQQQLLQYSLQQQQQEQPPLQQQLPSFSNQWDETDEFSGELGTSNVLPELDAQISIPSLQPWAGRHNFNVSMATNNKDRNKWCYSKELKKLFVCPMVAAPLDITVTPWVDASVRITPVYNQAQFRREPVTRCFNCKSTRGGDPRALEHIIQADNNNCVYEELPDHRYAVRIPLARAPPGDQSSTELIKLSCMTSCIGGPNRRPFCIILTLLCNSTGREIGRQRLDIKCCKSTHRDMCKEVEQIRPNPEPNPAPAVEEERRPAEEKVRRLASEIKVGQKRKKPSDSVKLEVITKEEPGRETFFVNVAVPIEFEREVKKFVNGLMAKKVLGNRDSCILYPEVEEEK